MSYCYSKEETYNVILNMKKIINFDQVSCYNLESEIIIVKNDLIQAINKLNDKEKKIVLYYYYEGLTTDKISNIIGCSSWTVKKNLSRGVEKIYNILNGNKEFIFSSNNSYTRTSKKVCCL